MAPRKGGLQGVSSGEIERLETERDEKINAAILTLAGNEYEVRVKIVLLALNCKHEGHREEEIGGKWR